MTATTGTLETVDGRYALRFERYLPHPVERVWRAVTEPAELQRWFVAVADWTPAPGEVFEAFGQTGEIAELDPPRLIAWTFGADRFRFELRAESGGCALVFVHVFADIATAAQTAAGWDCYLDRLDAHVAGGHLSEQRAHEPAGERHERYAARFGLDPTPGREFVATALGFRGLALERGPVLRLRRRYDQPAERVWRALTEPEQLAQWFPGDLEVTQSEPARLLVGSWNGGTLRFELWDEGDGCVLVFTHEFTDGDRAAMAAAGWDRCFARLDAVLAGASMSEAVSLAAWPAVHERYAASWGIDPAIGRGAYARHSPA